MSFPDLSSIDYSVPLRIIEGDGEPEAAAGLAADQQLQREVPVLRGATVDVDDGEKSSATIQQVVY